MRSVQLHPSTCGALNALLRLIEQLPNSLIPRDANDYADFVLSQESIRFAIRRAENQEAKAEALVGPPSINPDGGGKPSQVQIIRDALKKCPDEMPPNQYLELPFVKDLDLRLNLQLDLQATRTAVSNGEWKAGTVLAGSLVEALLLWAIQETPTTAVQSACANTVPKIQQPDPLYWDLHKYVEVAEQLKVIEPDTAKQVRLAKDFRNLIHPGRAIRTQQSCDRGTALAANAAVELVARDLTARFP